MYSVTSDIEHMPHKRFCLARPDKFSHKSLQCLHYQELLWGQQGTSCSAIIAFRCSESDYLSCGRWLLLTFGEFWTLSLLSIFLNPAWILKPISGEFLWELAVQDFEDCGSLFLFSSMGLWSLPVCDLLSDSLRFWVIWLGWDTFGGSSTKLAELLCEFCGDATLFGRFWGFLSESEPQPSSPSSTGDSEIPAQSFFTGL